jgi:hypothetical protein
MKPANANSLMDEGPAVDAERSCPECGAPMIEFDRQAENGAVFIWYSCTRQGCTGQWLTKRALRMCGA